MDSSADEIEARLRGQTRRLVIAAAQLGSMKWVAEHLSARAVIAAGMGIKDQVREAIQLLSTTQMAERTVYTHTGGSRQISRAGGVRRSSPPHAWHRRQPVHRLGAISQLCA